MKSKRHTFNAPDGVTVIPKVLIMVKHYWGSGDTIDNAWKRVSEESGKSIAKLKKEPHIIYSCFDYINNEHESLTVKTYISDMGSICYHQDYPPTIIHSFK